MRHPVVIAGAGVGGLSTAIHLQASGIPTVLIDRNERVGGKLNLVEEKGYRFDTGPSLLTMPEVFDDLFETAGLRLRDVLDVVFLDPYCRYFFDDGSMLETSDSMYGMSQSLLRQAPEDVDAFFAFLAKAAAWYRLSVDSVIYGPPMDWRSMRGSKLDPVAFFRARPFEQLGTVVERTFKSEKIRRIVRLISLYTGCDPRRTPAIFALIPFLEFGLGRWYVQGGLYSLAEKLVAQYVARGGVLRLGVTADRVEFSGGHATAVVLSTGERLVCDDVVINTDVATASRTLLVEAPGARAMVRRLDKLRPSTSAFVMMIGVRKAPRGLVHHNILFSADEKREWADIFERGVAPDDPTVYLNHPSFTDRTLAPEGGAALFAMVNVSANDGRFDWAGQKEAYVTRVLDILDRRAALPGLRDEIETLHVRTPIDFRERTSADQGSLYGKAPDSLVSMMRRPRNWERGFEGCWFVGGTTHPGAGIPLAALSGKLVASRIRAAAER